MPKRFTKIIIPSALLAAMTLASCGGTGDAADGAENTEAAVTTAATTEYLRPQTDLTGLSGDELRAAMIEMSLTYPGNTHRLYEKLTAAAGGEEITAVYLGGSITEGVGAGADSLCYAKLSFDYINEKYGGGMTYVNSGMSGTPSVLGNIRAERDVFSHEADIVFIEFAVNDGYEDVYKKSYESLVRTILSQENEPAVILIFNVIESGHTCQPWMQEIGEYYDLPMISPADSLTAAFDAGALTWSDYSADQSHPNIWGHELIADMIANYFGCYGDTETVSSYEMPAVPLFGNDYEGITFLDASDLNPTSLGSFTAGGTIAQFPNGYVYQPGTGNEPLTFEITAEKVFLLYREANSDSYGTAQIMSDGENYTIVNANSPSGWNNPQFQLIFNNLAPKTRVVSIKMADGFEDKSFEILGVAYK